MDETTTSTITAALREAADLLEQHPQLPWPYITSSHTGVCDLSWYLHHEGSLEQQKATAADIVRAIDGTWDKSADNAGWFAYRQTRGRLKLFISVQREAVCERVVVGTETRVVPAVEAQPERVEVVEKVEWRCQPLLADDTATGEAPADDTAAAKATTEIFGGAW